MMEQHAGLREPSSDEEAVTAERQLQAQLNRRAKRAGQAQEREARTYSKARLERVYGDLYARHEKLKEHTLRLDALLNAIASHAWLSPVDAARIKRLLLVKTGTEAAECRALLDNALAQRDRRYAEPDAGGSPALPAEGASDG